MSDAAPAWVAEHLRAGERAVWWARPARAGALAILAYTTITAAVLVGSYRAGFDSPGILLEGAPALVVALLGVLLEAGRRLTRLLRTSYVVTDDRLYVVTSRFATDVQAIPLSRLARVELRQSPLGRLLGYWSAEVRAYGEAERSRVVVRAIADGPGLFGQLSVGLERAARASWVVRGD